MSSSIVGKFVQRMKTNPSDTFGIVAVSRETATNFLKDVQKLYGEEGIPSTFACHFGSSEAIGRRITGVLLLEAVPDRSDRGTIINYIDRILKPCVQDSGEIWYTTCE